MTDRVAFSLRTAPGGPVATSGTLTTLAYKTKTGNALTPPPVSHIVDGVWGFTPSDSDVAQGACYLIDTGGLFPQYVFGAVFTEAQPFAALLFNDFAGSLWAGAAPTVGPYVSFVGANKPKPSLTALYGQSFFGLVPSDSDLVDGVAWRVDGPSGAVQTDYSGAFARPFAALGLSLAEDLVAALKADGTVMTLSGGRIYPNLRPPAAAFPLVVFSVISQVAENALAETAQTRLKHTRVQIDCYGQSYDSADDLATAVENVVANISTPDFAGWKDSRRDLYDNEAKLHRASVDFIVSRG